jgi:DNA-binding response OmpR family regulator
MKILLVEDQDDLRTSLQIRLQEECFVVDSASDGEKGSFLARTNDYDIIILDNHLPKKNGIEICKDIRESKKQVPIIILSVLDDTDQKVELLEAGADDYLTKPFSFYELMARIRAILRRPQKLVQSLFQIDDLLLDAKKHEVRRGTTEIYLTKKEFMLLEFLLHHRESVVSRGEILEHVWDIHADPFSNTIETHILSLRKKIDIEGKHKLIHNISGRGYKIGLKK